MARKRRSGGWIAALVVLLAIAATIANFYFVEKGELPVESPLLDVTPPPEGAEHPLAETTAVEGEPTPTPGPELEGTDEVVRRLAAGLSSHPQFAKWLATEHLIRRFVAVVDNVAAGKIPKQQLPFLSPEGEFQVVEKGGRPYVDPRGYRRYDAAAEVVASLDARGLVELYGELEPFIEEAYRELGYPDRKFTETLERAIDRILAVPVVEDEIALDPRVITHEYADPRLEELSPIEKQLLRMGPENVKKIQAKLREIRELPAAEPAAAATPAG